MFLFGIERGIGDERCKWQLEKGVDGNASRIDGSYSGGGDYDCAFGRFFSSDCVRRLFSGSCFSGEEEMGASILYYLPGTL